MAHTLFTLYTVHSLLWSSFACAVRFSLHLFLFLLEGVALQDDLLIPSLVAYLLVADRGQHLPIVGVFVTLPREQGGCSFAVGRSSLSLSPPPARGHIPGFAPTTGGCGALRRGARRMVLQAANTMTGMPAPAAVPPVRLVARRSTQKARCRATQSMIFLGASLGARVQSLSEPNTRQTDQDSLISHSWGVPLTALACYQRKRAPWAAGVLMRLEGAGECAPAPMCGCIPVPRREGAAARAPRRPGRRACAQ